MDLDIKVTRIDGRYHARLRLNEKTLSEWACRERQDIGYICYELMRWFDKVDSIFYPDVDGKYASETRRRFGTRKYRQPVGKVWGPAELSVGIK